MAKGRRKRDDPDGVALSEWIFFGVLLILPIGCFGVYAIVSRWCWRLTHFMQGTGLHYCSFHETTTWLVDSGGWWKLLILFAIVGLFAYPWRDDQEGREQASKESEKTESDD